MRYLTASVRGQRTVKSLDLFAYEWYDFEVYWRRQVKGKRMESRSSSNMTDEAFIAAFEGGSFGRTEFAHRSHLRMAWIYVRQLGVEGAIEKATAGIRAMAEK